ncbi:hypothetical protein [Streptomyces sp. NPDC016845]|uniref:hypothetical protein n=1 Tax=Streptomyces sp. NPDC016845 TaxID=3364972 RepID=UPI00378958C2
MPPLVLLAPLVLVVSLAPLAHTASLTALRRGHPMSSSSDRTVLATGSSRARTGRAASATGMCVGIG